MITVMGASGRVGSAILDALAWTERPLRALCRKPPAKSAPGIDWQAVDALDSDALTRVFAGAEAVFVMNPVPADAQDVDEQAGRLSASVARALQDAEVPYAVALSSQGAHLAAGTGIITTLHGFEQALRQTATRLSVLRPAYFMESWIPPALIAAESGQMPALLHPLDRPIDCVSARDVGAAAARRLLEPKPGTFNLTGPRCYAETDAAAILTRIFGRDITPAPIAAPDVAGFHEAAGLGASFSAGIAAMYAALNTTGIPFSDAHWLQGKTTLETVLGRLG